MKKITALILTMFYSCANAFAFSELYYFKNIKTSELMPTVKEVYQDKGFTLSKENPYLGTSDRNPEDYAVVIIQQSGNNMFYYYQSNGNKKINKEIIKRAKGANVTVEQSFNSNLLSIFDNLANEVINPAAKKQYNFEEETATTSQTKKTSSSSNTLQGYVAQIEKGTKFDVYLQNPINTSTAQVGDSIVAVLTNDWVYNGYVIAPQGSLVYGSLTLAHPAQYGSRNGRVVINFDRIVTTTGHTINVSTEKIDFSVDNDGKLGSTAKNVATGAIVGALGGLILAALAGGDNIGRAAAIGAGVGAGSAAIGSGIEKGIDAEIPSFTELELVLTEPLRVTLSR